MYTHSLRFFLSTKCTNENTPKIGYKNKKCPLLVKKAFSIFTLCEGSGNYRKKLPQDVLYFGMDNLWFSVLPSSIYAANITSVTNTASNSFRKLPTLPKGKPNLFSEHYLNCRNHDDETDGFRFLFWWWRIKREKHNGEHHLLWTLLWHYPYFYLLNNF